MAYKDKRKMTDYVNNRNKEVYDRIGLMAEKETGEAIRAAAAARGKSLNEYILTAVLEKMSRDASE